MDVPVVDIEGLVADLGAGRAPGTDARDAASRIDRACRTTGFFTVTGHGVDTALLGRLESLAREFFALPETEKGRISMRHGGRAWRGWFPVGGELTSGVPDVKEGIYFGRELDRADPRVRAGRPLHGPNLFPDRPAALRSTVLEVMEELTRLGHRVMSAIGVGLGLGHGWFDRHLTGDPVVLFRLFHYPARPSTATHGRTPSPWGVGEHTDYGLLTILHTDRSGGLQVHTDHGWVDVDPPPGALVCNIGDMLDRMTGGRYRATPHRVAVPTADRISAPFFFDPSWDAIVRELPLPGEPPRRARERWDGTSLEDLSGTYGDYLMSKVARVFPDLGAEVL